MNKLFILSLLFLTSCADPFEYSAKQDADIWAEHIHNIEQDGNFDCRMRMYKNKNIEFRSIFESYSLADDLPNAGVVYKEFGKHKETLGYLLYAKCYDGVCRPIIYERTKEDFNLYCNRTPFYMFRIDE